MEKKEFLEHNKFSGNYYGTCKKEIERINKDGKICLLEMDINGASQVKKIKYPANFLAILPKSTEDVRERLKGRGTESEELIEKRINIGLKELEEINNTNIFDYKIINDDLETAYIDLKEKLDLLYKKEMI